MSTTPQRQYTPDDPYDVKGDWVRHDLLAMVADRPSRVLSLGCGTGATEMHLVQKGASVFGIDVSADAVAIAAKRLETAIVADIESDPLPQLRPGTFDLILCGDVLEHLRFAEHVLDRLRGWLADDGQLVLSVPNATHYTILRQLVLRRDWKYEDAGLFDRGHYRLFTRKSLLRLLDEHGFRVASVSFLRPLSPKVKILFTLLRPLVWIVPPLNEYFVQNWIVRAHKKR